MGHRRILIAFGLAAAAVVASGQTGVTELGRAASCRTASLLQNLQSIDRLSGFEVLFGTVLTKVDPGLRRSAFRTLVGPGKCPLATAARSACAGATSGPVRPAALRPAGSAATRRACGSLA
ncbi:MAG: hypothetical protein ACRD16_07150 [Thermoanaerobaculia bacterium]